MAANGFASRNYLRWDAPSVEKVPPGEAEDIQAVADMINTMQKAQYNNHRHMYGGMSRQRRSNRLKLTV
jgi:hypothetical protein